jgi:hypothetical protein
MCCKHLLGGGSRERVVPKVGVHVDGNLERDPMGLLGGRGGARFDLPAGTDVGFDDRSYLNFRAALSSPLLVVVSLSPTTTATSKST